MKIRNIFSMGMTLLGIGLGAIAVILATGTLFVLLGGALESIAGWIYS